jgi:hypothetical protein
MKTLLRISILLLALTSFGLNVKSQNPLSGNNPGHPLTGKPMDSLMLSSQYVQGMITLKLKKGTGDFGKQTGVVAFGIQSLDDKVAQYQVNQLDKRFLYNPLSLITSHWEKW